MDDYPHAHHCRHGLAGDTGDFRLQGHDSPDITVKVTAISGSGLMIIWKRAYLFTVSYPLRRKKLGKYLRLKHSRQPAVGNYLWKLTMKWWCRWASESACY